jgi:hypothetical protein
MSKGRNRMSGSIPSSRFHSEDMLADALMNVVFLLLLTAASGVFLVDRTDRTPLYFYQFLLVIPAFVLFLVRRLRFNIGIMILFHLIPALFPLFLLGHADSAVIVFMTLSSFTLMGYSIRFSFRKSQEYISAPLTVASVLTHILLLAILGLRGIDTLNPYVIASALFCICLYFAVRQVVNFHNSFEHFLLSPSQPAKQIYANNLRVIQYLFIAILIIIPVSVVFPFDYPVRILKAIGNVIIRIILFFLSLGRTATETEDEGGIAEASGEAVPELSPPIAPDIIGRILDYAVYTLFFIMLIYAFYKLYHFVSHYLLANFRQRNGNSVHYKNPNVMDEVISIRRKKRLGVKRSHVFGTGEERKIRKQYYAVVKKEMSKGAVVTKASTADEILRAIHENSGADISELTKSYKKMRYGLDNHSNQE